MSMNECKPVGTPLPPKTKFFESGSPLSLDVPYAAVVGKLLYLALMTLPDLAFSAAMLAILAW